MCHWEQRQGQIQGTQNEFHESEPAWQRWQCFLGCQAKKWMSLWCSLAFPHSVGLRGTRLIHACWSWSAANDFILLVSSHCTFNPLPFPRFCHWNLPGVSLCLKCFQCETRCYNICWGEDAFLQHASPRNVSWSRLKLQAWNVFCRIWQNSDEIQKEAEQISLVHSFFEVRKPLKKCRVAAVSVTDLPLGDLSSRIWSAEAQLSTKGWGAASGPLPFSSSSCVPLTPTPLSGEIYRFICLLMRALGLHLVHSIAGSRVGCSGGFGLHWSEELLTDHRIIMEWVGWKGP